MSEKTLDELIAEMEELLSKMRTVKEDDLIESNDVNYINQFVRDAVQALIKLYDKYREKTGKTIPEVERLISIATVKQILLMDCKTGDIYSPSIHNNIIDTMKPVDVALKILKSKM